jgi:CRP/FNR family cyclic AMP-dependent transcriptional regulator
MDVGGSLRAVLAYCDGLPEVRFKPGDVLIPEGPSTGLMFILAAGSIEIVRGETPVAEIHDPGAIFGEMAALLQATHSATVRAASDVVAFRIDDARAFLQNRPEIVFHVACILAQRLNDATAYLADFKAQFADRSDHFGLVDEVMEALVQKQRRPATGGSQLKSDPRL